MFDDCYLRIGREPFRSCAPLTVQLMASLYALPERVEQPIRHALESLGEGRPWSRSLAVAPDRTAASVAAMLRQVMLATRDLDPGSIETDSLQNGSRVRFHLEALRDLWLSDPAVAPPDIAKVQDLLGCEASDALQPLHVIWDRDSPALTVLERVVLERLESHHGRLGDEDGDVFRLVADRKAPGAPQTSLAGHVQRNLLNPKAPRVPLDDSLAVLAVRDSLTECEAAAAIIQHWLDGDLSLKGSDVGVIVPASSDYAMYLAETFARAGLLASSMPTVARRRNLGGEALLHFLQCRRQPAPAMALASLFCSPVLCWSPDIGAALADSVMSGDFQPQLAHSLTGKPAALFTLIRAVSPATTGKLKDQLRAFHGLLSADEAAVAEVREVKQQITRLINALSNAGDAAEPDLEKAIQLAAAYQEIPPERGPYYLGGVSVILAHEAPKRRFRKLLVLGFNDGAFPSPASGNPFFLDSEVALIYESTGLALPSQAKQLDAALTLFNRQLNAATEQVILLLSERDRSGDALSVSASLPLIARLIEGLDEPDKLVLPIERGKGTIWDRVINWRSPPRFELVKQTIIPAHYNLGINLLNLRQKADGTPTAQSPSRLEKLLVSPLAWLLSELDAEHISWQPEMLDFALRGSLAHEVFERLFPPGNDHPDDATIESKAPEVLIDRIRAIAPFLQTAPWKFERATLESEIIKAAKQWSMVLRSLDAEILGNEFWLSGALFGHPVHGKADCLLRLPGGQPVMVDYKKSSTRTRRQRLEKGWDLQVDLYRRMTVTVGDRSKEGAVRIAGALTSWHSLPAVAYHTLNDGNVLLNGMEDLDSPHVELVTGDIAENALGLIEARFKALKAGRLDTNTTADEKAFQKFAALGTYALNDSPLVTAFMRLDTEASVRFTGHDDGD